MEKSDQKFLGQAQLPGAILHRIGGGVGLRFTNDLKQIAHGEVFEIDPNLWRWLDDIEFNGFVYTRKIVPIQFQVGERFRDGAPVYESVNAWVYEHTFPGMVYRSGTYVDGVYPSGGGYARL